MKKITAFFLALMSVGAFAANAQPIDKAKDAQLAIQAYNVMMPGVRWVHGTIADELNRIATEIANRHVNPQYAQLAIQAYAAMMPGVKVAPDNAGPLDRADKVGEMVATIAGGISR